MHFFEKGFLSLEENLLGQRLQLLVIKVALTDHGQLFNQFGQFSSAEK